MISGEIQIKITTARLGIENVFLTTTLDHLLCDIGLTWKWKKTPNKNIVNEVWYTKKKHIIMSLRNWKDNFLIYKKSKIHLPQNL